MTRVPILTEVVLRAWGTDDPRVLPCLRAENQPGRGFRTNAVEGRARDAGWPALLMIDAARKAATAAVKRLEGVDFLFPIGSRRPVGGSYYRATRGTDEDTRPVRPVLTIYDE